MNNEAHVIGDRVPNEHDLIVELKLVPSNSGTAAAQNSSHPGPTLARRLFRAILHTIRQRRDQAALLELSDDQLKDIGLSRCQAYGGYSRYRRNEGPEKDELNQVQT